MSNKRHTHALEQSSLYRLKRRAKLACLLGVSDSQLRYLTKYANELYRERDMVKKNGGIRHIEDPMKLLKLVQGRLANLLSRISPPEFLFCPVKRRCYVSNAAQHRGNRVIKTLDIQKYFPNTTSRRVFWFFETVMGCPRDIAGTLATLACFQGHLPTGSPLSPIMAFFAFYDMWHEIAGVCRREGLTLTVYVDDVTVSGNSVPEEIMWEIRKIIHRVGLRYHKEKAFFDRPAEVTGVFVKGDALEAPFKQFKKLRTGVASIQSPIGNMSDISVKQIEGLKGQLRQIERIAARLG